MQLASADAEGQRLKWGNPFRGGAGMASFAPVAESARARDPGLPGPARGMTLRPYAKLGEALAGAL